MPDPVVQGYSTAMGFIQHALGLPGIKAERVEGQRPRSCLNVGNGLVEGGVFDDGQQRAEDLFLSHLHVVGDGGDHLQRQATGSVA
ncbi:hypothetical protein D9M71_766450 [compost metagenome]